MKFDESFAIFGFSLRCSVMVLPFVVVACVNPNEDLFAEYSDDPRVGPSGPAPDAEAYGCEMANGSSCKKALARIWLPGWRSFMMAARGNKAAFCGYRALPSGQLEPQMILHGGQVDLTTGQVDWIIPLGKDQQDFEYIYDAHVAANGTVVFLGSGFGKLLIDDAGSQRDNITVAFDQNGTKLFAKRLEIWDTAPKYRPTFIGSKTFSDDVLRIRTSFHSFPEAQPGLTIFAANLFTLQFDGTQTLRVDVPQTTSIHYEDTHLGPDGSIWTWQAPAPMYQYSKDGKIVHTFDIEKPENLDVGITRGFAPIGSESVLANLSSTKGATNEVYQYDAGKPRTLVFEEPQQNQFGAGEMRTSLDGSRAYFIEQGYDGSTYRFATIADQGKRGPVAIVHGVLYQFSLYDQGVGVFYRVNEQGTEFIVQPL
jgi:hypothetical protein